MARSLHGSLCAAALFLAVFWAGGALATVESEPNGMAGDPECYEIQPAENCPPNPVTDNWIQGNVTAASAALSTDHHDFFEFTTTESCRIDITVSQCDRSSSNECTQFSVNLWGQASEKVVKVVMDDLGSGFTWIGPGYWLVDVYGDWRDGCELTTADYHVSWTLTPLASDADEIEDNDTAAKACAALPLNIGCLGCYRAGGSGCDEDRDCEDYYSFEAPASGVVRLRLDSDAYRILTYPQWFWVTIEDNLGNELARGDFSIGSVTAEGMTPGETYYIHVHTESNRMIVGGYEISFGSPLAFLLTLLLDD